MGRNPTNTEDLWVKFQEEWFRARAHLLNIDCTYDFIIFWLFTSFFSILSLTFGHSK